MLTPTTVTDFDRSDDDLELFLLFCILVAGKNSDWAMGKVYELLDDREMGSPFDYLHWGGLEALRNKLVAHRVGQYDRIVRAIDECKNLRLREVTVETLEGIHGIGPKTARFFVLHSQKDARCAVLDVHQLKWLSQFCDNVPQQTPQRRTKYRYYEVLWLTMTDVYFPDVPKAVVDLMIWAQMSGRDLDSAIPQEWRE